MCFRTQRDVATISLPPGKREVIECDEQCRGLEIRLQGRAKVWIVRYQLLLIPPRLRGDRLR